MISQITTDNPQSFQETIVFWSLVFVLGILSIWTAISGATPAPFFLLVFGLAFLSAVLFPRAGMMALIVSTVLFQRFFTQAPLVYHDVLIKLYPLDALLGGSLLFLIASFFIKRGHQSRWLPFDKWLLVFFGYVSILLLVTVFGGGLGDGAIAFSTWKNYVFYGCFYFVAREIFSGANGRRVLGKTFFLAVAAALIFLVIGIVRGDGLWTEFNPLSTSGIRILDFPHALYFSLVFLSLLFLSASSQKIFGRFQKFFTFVLPVLLFIGIIGSLMRHLWIALFVGMVVGFVFLPVQMKARLIRKSVVLFGIFTIVGVLGIALLTLAPQSQVARQSSYAVASLVERVISVSAPGIDESVAWRGSVWQSAIGSFSQNPLFGTGLGQNVPVELGDYHDFVVVRNIHNSWLALFVQTGFVGSLFFLLFFLGLVKSLARKVVSSDEAAGVRATYMSLLVFYSVAFLFQPYLESNILATFFWILLGLIAAFVQEKTPYENY